MNRRYPLRGKDSLGGGQPYLRRCAAAPQAAQQRLPGEDVRVLGNFVAHVTQELR